ncbi:MAG: AI-2E family transporter [Janthinobacterium lividum]
MSESAESRLPKARVPAAESLKPEGLLGLAVGVVVVAALYLAREVLIPITLSILLSFVLAPLVRLLRRLHLPRVLAVILSVVLALGTILMLGGLIGLQVATLADGLPQYQTTIEHKVDSARAMTVGRMNTLLARIGPALGGATPPAARPARGDAPAAPPAPPPAQGKGTDAAPTVVSVQPPALSPMELARRYASPVLAPLETLGVVFIVAIFVLMQQEDLRDRLIRLFGSSDLHRTTLALDDAGSRLSRYFLTQLCINAAFGVVVGLGLLLIGVPSPILWGTLGALLRFVPYVGALIAAVLPVALAAAVDPGWSMAGWTLALFVVTEGVMGQAVEPLLYGHSTGLSPIAVVVVAIFWSWLWGPIGLILSTPLTLCLVVLGRHVKRLEFFDVLLGDRPALTPVETFYQRLLAQDPDEVQEQAEALLKTRALSSYYDEVALKGLQLAASDVSRGVLTEAQVADLRDELHHLIEELDVHDDTNPEAGKAGAQPGVAGVERPERDTASRPAPEAVAPAPEDLAPAWRGPAPVLCVAGRGPLDEAASEMLAQLLRKHGLGATIAPFEAASRAGIAGLDPEGVAMVCVSYLELSGSPTHLRFLLRRLRARLPNATILIGLWPADGDLLRDPASRETLGADHYATSLRDAVALCVAEAHGPASPEAVRSAAE